MFLDARLVRREVNAVHLVSRDVAVEPLNLRAHAFQDADGFLGEFPPLGIGQICGSRNLTFDYKFGHWLASELKS